MLFCEVVVVFVVTIIYLTFISILIPSCLGASLALLSHLLGPNKIRGKNVNSVYISSVSRYKLKVLPLIACFQAWYCEVNSVFTDINYVFLL
jgi:hypothetical protein